jgi:hypothetical protein
VLVRNTMRLEPVLADERVLTAAVFRIFYCATVIGRRSVSGSPANLRCFRKSPTAASVRTPCGTSRTSCRAQSDLQYDSASDQLERLWDAASDRLEPLDEELRVAGLPTDRGLPPFDESVRRGFGGPGPSCALSLRFQLEV